jgi:hypothetical protein
MSKTDFLASRDHGFARFPIALTLGALLLGVAQAATYQGIVNQVGNGGPTTGLPGTGQPTTNPSATTGAVTSDRRLQVLDPTFYVNAYPDLKAAFGANVAAAQNHWLTYGINEGRQSSATFAITSYIARYPDLKRAFGNNYAAALDHWFNHGINEKRDPSPTGRFQLGAIVRLASSGATYIVDAEGKKRWIQSPAVFDGCGLTWNLSQDLPQALIDAVPAGGTLGTAQACQEVRAGRGTTPPASNPTPTPTPTPTPGTNTSASVAAALGALPWPQLKYVIDNDPGMKESYDKAGATLQAMIQANPSSFPWSTVTANRPQATLDRIAALINESWALNAPAPTQLAAAITALNWAQFQAVARVDTGYVKTWFNPPDVNLAQNLWRNTQAWTNVFTNSYTPAQRGQLQALIDKARNGQI